MGLSCSLQSWHRMAEKQRKGSFQVVSSGKTFITWHNFNCVSSSLKILDANRKRPKPNNKNQQQATTKNRLNCSEGADRNRETEFFALFWKKLPYFSFWNLSSGFLEVVGVSSITSDPSLMVKNLSLRWDEIWQVETQVAKKTKPLTFTVKAGYCRQLYKDFQKPHSTGSFFSLFYLPG